ncbi:MAG TPA: flavodoxin [Kandleria vitulina]|nr:flavodoxin [Kandleria vitulina]
MNTLIVYYSQARGNTKRIAEMIQKKKGYAICRLETEKPYEGTYEDIVEQGQNEVNNGVMPKLKELDISLNEYDRFIVMTPTWWYTMAPAVFTFLSENDFSGKTIVPVQTHGGWPGHVIEDMENIANAKQFTNEFAVQFDSTGGDQLITDEKDILEWINQL